MDDTTQDAPAAVPPSAELSLPARLEAILYLKGRSMTLGELAEISGVAREAVEMGLITLMADYAHRDTALEIRQEGQRYSLQLPRKPAATPGNCSTASNSQSGPAR